MLPPSTIAAAPGEQGGPGPVSPAPGAESQPPPAAASGAAHATGEIHRRADGTWDIQCRQMAYLGHAGWHVNLFTQRANLSRQVNNELNEVIYPSASSNTPPWLAWQSAEYKGSNWHQRKWDRALRRRQRDGQPLRRVAPPTKMCIGCGRNQPGAYCPRTLCGPCCQFGETCIQHS